MNSLDWFQNGLLFLLLSKAAYQDRMPYAGVSGMLFAVGVGHLAIALIETLTGNTP